MSFLKAKELRTKNLEQLAKMLSERQEKMRHLRFQISRREVKNNQELKFLRREIARIHTVIRSLALKAN
ncbi:MAG: 50S ribosomal protein L29 [Patescibacteria group bacterium]|nr:50S ribosomal protein L29 [Patescibacteria group bacterium]